MDHKSKLGIGSVQFGTHYGISNIQGQTSRMEVSKIIRLALKEGINLLDTAGAYGDAEIVLGQNNPGAFKVVSKFLTPKAPETIGDHLNRSLTRLQIKELYGFIAHRPLDVYANPLLWEELKELKNTGFIEKIGFSLNEPAELTSLLNLGIMPDLIQVPFNYFDRRFTTHLIEIKKSGCEVHARSSFLQGIFFADVKSLPPYFDEIKPNIKSLQESITSLSGSLLRFVIEKPFIDKVIMGVENCNQLLLNLKSIENSAELPELKVSISEKILVPSNWPKC
jgi:aryl-alcohol dehydrogenase-like predicted oxidoreductase